MDFRLTREQAMVQKLCREFAVNEVEPIAAEIDAEERYPFETVEKMRKYGLMGIQFPKELGGSGADSGSGQLMAFINEPTGRICSWGIPLAEAYGVRLSADYAGPVPAQMQLMDVPAGEYLVFEHGPFDFETQNAAVEAKVEQTMRDFDYAASGYRLDLTPDRVFYFYHDCARFFKYVRPVCRA